ncbi:hypothetical protein EV360DRAFT_74606 [Lentinula raphanica]|nr:hypothetical protein EV360DRAFT_74606 [Lentinula raphanica]
MGNQTDDCNRDQFEELSILVTNCQAYLPFLTFDRLFKVSSSSEYQAALDPLFLSQCSLENSSRPYALYNAQMKRLHNISTQLHSAAIIESRFLPTTQRHNILPADHLALVAFENLNFLLDCIPSTRTALEIMWWNFLDKDPKRSGKMLTGIINEGRNRPEQYWKKLINISFYDFSSLGVGRWLNDEIINYFVNKWCIQSKKVLGFSTFFASRCLFEENTSCLEAKKWFTEDDEKRVLSWVRARQRFLKLEVWDAVFIPIHENESHWYSAYIDFRLKRIEIYDSLQQTYLDNYTKPAILRKNTRITLVLMWLTEILSQAKGEYLDLKNNQHSGWLFSPHSRVPFQPNSYDCGVHTLWHLKHLLEQRQVMLGRECQVPGLSFTDDMVGKRVCLALELLQDCEPSEVCSE